MRTFSAVIGTTELTPASYLVISAGMANLSEVRTYRTRAISHSAMRLALPRMTARRGSSSLPNQLEIVRMETPASVVDDWILERLRVASPPGDVEVQRVRHARSGNALGPTANPMATTRWGRIPG